MTEDMKKAFAALMPFFPKRLIKEPLQVLREIYAILKKDTESRNSSKPANRNKINKSKNQ
ncbi:MAG: hypothetical protein FJW56_10540 [Actinobacteria bacterium]|nr:hypothetical protein [Actinomycetota bacterium]